MRGLAVLTLAMTACSGGEPPCGNAVAPSRGIVASSQHGGVQTIESASGACVRQTPTDGRIRVECVFQPGQAAGGEDAGPNTIHLEFTLPADYALAQQYRMGAGLELLDYGGANSTSPSWGAGVGDRRGDISVRFPSDVAIAITGQACNQFRTSLIVFRDVQAALP